MTIRCATPAEHREILVEPAPAKPGHRLLILETASRSDYVVTGAFGWKQDDGGDRDPSALAFFPPGIDPTRILP